MRRGDATANRFQGKSATWRGSRLASAGGGERASAGPPGGAVFPVRVCETRSPETTAASPARVGRPVRVTW